MKNSKLKSFRSLKPSFTVYMHVHHDANQSDRATLLLDFRYINSINMDNTKSNFVTPRNQEKEIIVSIVHNKTSKTFLNLMHYFRFYSSIITIIDLYQGSLYFDALNRNDRGDDTISVDGYLSVIPGVLLFCK